MSWGRLAVPWACVNVFLPSPGDARFSFSPSFRDTKRDWRYLQDALPDSQTRVVQPPCKDYGKSTYPFGVSQKSFVTDPEFRKKTEGAPKAKLMQGARCIDPENQSAGSPPSSCSFASFPPSPPTPSPLPPFPDAPPCTFISGPVPAVGRRPFFSFFAKGVNLVRGQAGRAGGQGCRHSHRTRRVSCPPPHTREGRGGAMMRSSFLCIFGFRKGMKVQVVLFACRDIFFWSLFVGLRWHACACFCSRFILSSANGSAAVRVGGRVPLPFGEFRSTTRRLFLPTAVSTPNAARESCAKRLTTLETDDCEVSRIARSQP